MYAEPITMPQGFLGLRCILNLSIVGDRLHQMGYRDKAWSVNKMGHVAFK
jgi:hypothetical protein